MIPVRLPGLNPRDCWHSSLSVVDVPAFEISPLLHDSVSFVSSFTIPRSFLCELGTEIQEFYC